MIDAITAEKYMSKCVHAARQAVKTNNYPLAAMVVWNREILSVISSDLRQSLDPTAHPETVAIRQACEQKKTRYLPDAVLISTLEPCPMCTSVAIWAKFAGIVFGSSQEDAINWHTRHPNAPVSWRQIPIKAENLTKVVVPNLWIKAGILKEECDALFDLSLDLKR